MDSNVSKHTPASPGMFASPTVKLDESGVRALKRTGRTVAAICVALSATMVFLCLTLSAPTQEQGENEAAMVVFLWALSIAAALTAGGLIAYRSVLRPFADKAAVAARATEFQVTSFQISEDEMSVTFKVIIQTMNGEIRDRVTLPMNGIEWIGCGPKDKGRMLLEPLDISYQVQPRDLKRNLGVRGIVRRDPRYPAR
jgi:hypothetical protein